jgi:hypothetical protein
LPLDLTFRGLGDFPDVDDCEDDDKDKDIDSPVLDIKAIFQVKEPKNSADAEWFLSKCVPFKASLFKKPEGSGIAHLHVPVHSDELAQDVEYVVSLVISVEPPEASGNGDLCHYQTERADVFGDSTSSAPDQLLVTVVNQRPADSETDRPYLSIQLSRKDGGKINAKSLEDITLMATDATYSSFAEGDPQGFAITIAKEAFENVIKNGLFVGEADNDGLDTGDAEYLVANELKDGHIYSLIGNITTKGHKVLVTNPAYATFVTDSVEPVTGIAYCRNQRQLTFNKPSNDLQIRYLNGAKYAPSGVVVGLGDARYNTLTRKATTGSGDNKRDLTAEEVANRISIIPIATARENEDGSVTVPFDFKNVPRDFINEDGTTNFTVQMLYSSARSFAQAPPVRLLDSTIVSKRADATFDTSNPSTVTGLNVSYGSGNKFKAIVSYKLGEDFQGGKATLRLAGDDTAVEDGEVAVPLHIHAAQRGLYDAYVAGPKQGEPPVTWGDVNPMEINFPEGTKVTSVTDPSANNGFAGRAAIECDRDELLASNPDLPPGSTITMFAHVADSAEEPAIGNTWGFGEAATANIRVRASPSLGSAGSQIMAAPSEVNDNGIAVMLEDQSALADADLTGYGYKPSFVWAQRLDKIAGVLEALKYSGTRALSQEDIDLIDEVGGFLGTAPSAPATLTQVQRARATKALADEKANALGKWKEANDAEAGSSILLAFSPRPLTVHDDDCASVPVSASKNVKHERRTKTITQPKNTHEYTVAEFVEALLKGGLEAQTTYRSGTQVDVSGKILAAGSDDDDTGATWESEDAPFGSPTVDAKLEAPTGLRVIQHDLTDGRVIVEGYLPVSASGLIVADKNRGYQPYTVEVPTRQGATGKTARKFRVALRTEIQYVESSQDAPLYATYSELDDTASAELGASPDGTSKGFELGDRLDLLFESYDLTGKNSAAAAISAISSKPSLYEDITKADAGDIDAADKNPLDEILTLNIATHGRALAGIKLLTIHTRDADSVETGTHEFAFEDAKVSDSSGLFHNECSGISDDASTLTFKEATQKSGGLYNFISLEAENPNERFTDIDQVNNGAFIPQNMIVRLRAKNNDYRQATHGAGTLVAVAVLDGRQNTTMSEPYLTLYHKSD